MSKADPARVLACQVLHEVLEEQKFSHESLNEHLQNCNLTAQERSFATVMVYDCLSRLTAIDYILMEKSSRPLTEIEPLLRSILRLGIWQVIYAYSVPHYAAVNETVELCKHFNMHRASGFVNAILRNLDPSQISWRKKDKGVELGLGNELFGMFKKWYGEEIAEDIAEYFLSPAKSTDLRVNSRKTMPNQLIKDLREEGCVIESGRYFPKALRLVSSELRLDELKAYKKGEFMVQGESAQAVGVVADLSEARYIVDLCAAPGGKTCDLAERKMPEAQILAFDLHEGRLERARENALRLALDISFEKQDALAPDLSKLLSERWQRSQGKADLILADVPCSGLGDLAGKPELRQRMDYESIQRFPSLQKDFLKQAASLCRAGSEIIYSTCTLNPEENQNLLRDFLASASGKSFVLKDLRVSLPEGLKDCLARDAQLTALLDEGFLLFRPDICETDGFFVAVLQCVENE